MKKEQTLLIRNYIYNVAYQILSILIPLITVPYASRVLGAEKLGIYSYTYAVASYFAIAAYLGFENYGNRMIARCREDRELLNRSFSGAFYFQIVSGICACSAYLIYLLFLCGGNKVVAAIQFLYIGSQMINISWFYFGLEEFKKTAFRSMLVRIVSVVAILLFVKNPSDIVIYTIICAGSTMLGSAFLWINIGRYVRFVKVSVQEILVHARSCLVLFFPVLVINIYRSMDKIMLGQMADMREVAVYSNADKIVELPYGVIAALGVVMLPRMTNLIASGQEGRSRKYIEKSMQFMMMMSCGMAFGMIATGRYFAPLFFGGEFWFCGELIMIIAPMVIIRACANVVRTQYLLPNGRDRDYIVSLLVGVVINLAVNWSLIPKFQSVGAAVGTLLAESFVAVYQLAVCRKDIPVVRYTLQNWFFVVAGAIMGVIVYRMGQNRKLSVGLLVIQIGSGVLIYGGLSLIYLRSKGKRRKRRNESGK